MKIFYLAIISILILSCNRDDEKDPEPASTLTELNYPSGQGYSGNDVSSVIGYGYDATGLCDTLSIKSKVFNINFPQNLLILPIYYSGSKNLIGGYNYYDFLRNIKKYPYRINEPTYSFISHINNLLNIASGSEVIENDCAYAYYSYDRIEREIKYSALLNEMKSGLTDEFNNDINTLSSQEIINKYGTHVVLSALIGAKFEVIYKCNLNNVELNGEEVFNLLYKRMNDFFGEMPGYYSEQEENYSPSNEQHIFNSIGYAKKSFGIINATNNNSNGIFIDLNTALSNPKYQFVSIDIDGLVPLYEMIDDLIKKEELKTYIQSLITN